MTTGLLVVDVQADFCEGGSLAVRGGAAVARGVSALLRRRQQGPTAYPVVVASRDWHDADSDNGGHIALPPAEPDFVLSWPVHCVAGTPGAAYHSDFDVSSVTHHVRKGQGFPAYSAFEGVLDDGTQLADLLGGQGVDALDVVGIATDHCVLASARDALGLGLRVRVLTDLVAGVAADPSEAALRELRLEGAALTTLDGPAAER